YLAYRREPLVRAVPPLPSLPLRSSRCEFLYEDGGGSYGYPSQSAVTGNSSVAKRRECLVRRGPPVERHLRAPPGSQSTPRGHLPDTGQHTRQTPESPWYTSVDTGARSH